MATISTALGSAFLVVAANELNISFTDIPVVQDPDDPDHQTLLVRYLSVSSVIDNYVIPMIKIEVVAKSALEPHQLVSMQPYVAYEII